VSNWTEKDLQRFVARGHVAQTFVDKLVGSTIPNRSHLATLPSKAARMNKLETAYSQLIELERLAGTWQWWAFEAIKLRLAAGAWYTPDFALLDPLGKLVIHETKGHWREAAKVRIKVAAELYPMFRFVAVTRQRRKDGGSWMYKQY
jgi:hypothetical protein